MRRVPAALFAIAAAVVALAPHGRAQAARDAGADAAVVDARAEDAAAEDASLAEMRRTASAVRALLEEKLAVEVRPETLFDVPVAEDTAVELEAGRLAALLREVDREAKAATAGAPNKKPRARDAGMDGGEREIDPASWNARVDLDRARYAFYSLPSARRHELLAAHAKRQAAATPPPTDDELRARDAEALRQKALAAARDARSEAERVVSEEYARLLGVERTQAAFEKELTKRNAEITDRREVTLGWQRRAREARAKAADAVDPTYDELRQALRSARDELDKALDGLADGVSGVPEPGPNALADLATGVDMRAAKETRARVEATAGRLRESERIGREEDASQLLDEIDSLNGERLALLPFLSSAKRAAVTSFGGAGVDQAASELRQLTLIARYHRHATARWQASLRDPGQGLRQEAWRNIVLLVEWAFAVAAFLLARKRIPPMLRDLHKRSMDTDRRDRRASPGPATRMLAFALQVHSPLEWLALAFAIAWLLPAAAESVLEVQLVTVIVHWIIGGALVVDVVNALAGSGHDARDRAEIDTAALRLRSLRLVGRVVVTFGLILVLSARLVGRGTIYQWVLSTCWFASIPVLLVLVRWWRDTVFRRVEHARKKSPFEAWLLANRKGWKSFFAATAGGAYLFGRGAARATRSWVGRFDVTRRVLAYLFRRELDKLGAERAQLETQPIPDAAFDALGPETPSAEWIATDVDLQLDALTKRLRERRGGVIAVVGARGMGKSLMIGRLHDMFADTLLTDAPADGDVEALRGALAKGLQLAPEASLDQVGAAIAAGARGVLLDEAHRFIRPVMGGLAAFDALLATASQHSARTTWVFAVDEVIWLFLQRARGARPLFDDVIRLNAWRPEQIVALLEARTEAVGLKPTFERLLEKLPANADEIDKQEALARRAASYYGLLWDHASGNPGVALHMWRRSLGTGEDGATHVRFFQAMDSTDFERLPDPAVFVLRAVLQLAPVRAEEVGRATMLNAADVADALRYAVARGYLKEEQGHYRVTWTWFRAMTLFLQRRHLLVTP